MTEKELLELDYDNYIKECYKILNRHQKLMEFNMSEISCMEASWVRRYYLYKNGQYNVEV